MTGLVYKELPVNDITHLTRQEFINGQEQKFYDALLESMTKYGMRDPIFIHQKKDTDDKIILKVVVGNNRMVIAKKLGYKFIRSIIKLLDPNNNDLKGTFLKNEQEIIDLFFTKRGLAIKKENGIINEVMPLNLQKHGKI
tara:strand:+ start:4849 stop:5268 length:420 start_codon:yes stop_codon:yes gene_type:complete